MQHQRLIDDSVSAVHRAAAAGDAAALFQWGMWRLAGAPIPRNLPEALHAFNAAAARSHAEAMLVAVALTANGSGVEPNWRKARTMLEHAAVNDPIARYLVGLIQEMKIDATGATSMTWPIEDLVGDGRIRRVRSCLSRAECAHIIHSVTDLLQPAIVADPRTGRNLPHPIRTSDSAVISPLREDLVLRAINQRIASISDTAIGQGEALTVLRYQRGQQFRLHSDALPRVRNQRTKTVLLYLNDGYEGGETMFPDHNVTIVPKAGDAVIFTTTLSDGRPDPTMRHAGLPVGSGAKWLATRWIRQREFNVWDGPEGI